MDDVVACNGVRKVYSVKIVFTSSSGLEKVADFENLNINCVEVTQTGGSSSAPIVEEYFPPPVYTVSFDSQSADVGAVPTSMTVTVPATTVVTLPAPPTKTGYVFYGWFTEIEGGGAEFTENTTVAEDITVYAKWIEQTCGNGIIEGNEECEYTQIDPYLSVCTSFPNYAVICGQEYSVGCTDTCSGSPVRFCKIDCTLEINCHPPYPICT